MQWTYAEQLTDFSKGVTGEELISIRHQELGDPMQPEFLSHKDPSKLLTMSSPARSKMHHLAQPVHKHVDRLSTTIAVWPALVSGRSVMKSAVTHCHLNSCTGSGCNRPAGFSLDALLRWQ